MIVGRQRRTAPSAMAGRGGLSLLLLLFSVSCLGYGAYALYEREQAKAERREQLKHLAALMSGAREPGARKRQVRGPGGATIEITEEATSTIEVETPDTAPEEEVPRIYLPETALLEDDYFVLPKGDAPIAGDGTRESPWRGLQKALNRLAPGDRLIVLNGRYRGPVVIDVGAADGTPEAPITVYFASGAEIVGPQPDEGSKPTALSALVTIARSHWRLEGLNAIGGYVDPVLRVASTVEGLHLGSPHLRAASGSGIHVLPGASGVSLTDVHLHHLGSLEGRDRAASARYGSPGAAPFAALVVPAEGATVAGGKVHHVFGAPALLDEPSGRRRAPPELLKRWGLSVSEGEERWW